MMECLVVVDGRPVLFMRLARGWRVFRSPGISLTREKRLLLMNPLPWLADWHTAPQDELTLTRMGVVSANSLAGMTDGAQRPVLLADDDQQALLARQAAAERGDLAAWTDPGPVTAALHQARWPLALLKGLCAGQFLTVFLGAPWLVMAFPLSHVLLPFLALVYGFSACIASCWARIWLKTRHGSKFGMLRVLWLLIYPLAAMRAVQSITQGLVPARHETALARALLGTGRSGRVYICHALVRLRHCTWPCSLGPEAGAALAAANEELAMAIKAHWALGENACHPPCGGHAGAVCVCPVCATAMAVHEEYCPHCPEVRTVPCGQGE